MSKGVVCIWLCAADNDRHGILIIKVKAIFLAIRRLRRTGLSG